VPPVDWPHIDGIDTADASARWCGDVALFTSMLARLFEEYGEIDFPSNVEDSPAIGLYVRRMHKLRGGACMLGAKAVSGLAGRIEAACLAGATDQALRLSVTLGSEMQSLIHNAKPVLAAERLRTSEVSPMSPEAPTPDVIKELGLLLRQQSLAAADRFRALSPQLRKLMGEELYERMRRHVDNLQFDEASNDLRLGTERSNAAAKQRSTSLTPSTEGFRMQVPNRPK
jgi:HPt (histidine-containing phosphotransfer) domain-containing protein